MFKLFNTNRRTVLFAGCLVFVFVAVAFTLNVKTNSQQLKVLDQKDKELLLKKIADSTEQSLKVIENSDSPLRISKATVKEVSNSEFTQLTGKTTNILTVASFPEATLVNTSGKTITGFIFVIRDPKTKTLQTINQQKISIPSGATYLVKREHFFVPEKQTTEDKEGVHKNSTFPNADSEKYWIDFAERTDIFVTVGVVFFEDGSRWMLKEGDGIK